MTYLIHRSKQAKWGHKGICSKQRKDKTPEKELNEMEVNCLLEKAFRVRVIRMIINLCR